jgi:hypothetical protein
MRSVSVPLLRGEPDRALGAEAIAIAERIARDARVKECDLVLSLLMAHARLEAISAENARTLAELSAEIAALKRERSASLADSYRGSWLPHVRYERGWTVTHGGHLWLALDQCEGKPGETSGWKMIVKGAR